MAELYPGGPVRSAALLLLLTCPACASSSPSVTGKAAVEALPGTLAASWQAYVDHFIQKDGRVIDHSAGAITTSEGQAYAMLRAVWVDDRPTFDRVYNWAVHNLNSSVRGDHLWAWKWGKDGRGRWRALDKAFATDADEDAALALILASRVWNQEGYLRQAQAVLADLWSSGTVIAAGRRYLLAGDTLCRDGTCRLNPSYCAPYAYRVFGEVDAGHPWRELADSSYDFLSRCSSLTKTHLPPDWVQLELKSGRLTLESPKDGQFSYDAFRVYWRVDLDWAANSDTRAKKYMQTTLDWILAEWRKRGQLPAVITADGTPAADYQSLEMVSALMPAVATINAAVAARMNRTVQEAYSHGFWDGKDSYYLQNWAWFGTALYDKNLPPHLRASF